MHIIQNHIISDGEWLTDANGNRASIKHWGSLMVAARALESCTGCSGCTNCSGCTDCSNCTDCTRCHNCIDCADCWDSVHCRVCNHVGLSSHAVYCADRIRIERNRFAAAA